ncbi:hypothetical protein KGA65_17500 [Ideonella sp. B7]|uniref:hypothetical protein n=1 Tax=Ideonella benzenivorans TaxID=2831643 RepID=UPI001CEC3A8E|nr:hypothetical protein [Ideonella benzenivorans]MCA6218334.1 hypothetical protein [Ideonella benzenivorans]
MSVLNIRRLNVLALACCATVALTACGGGGDGSPDTSDGTGGTDTAPLALSCNTAAYQPGSVVLPTADQLAVYAGTFQVTEGHYDAAYNFVASGSGTLVIAANGAVSYNGKAYPPSSACLDAAAGPYGQLLYLFAGQGHLEIATAPQVGLGQAWGSSPVDGTTLLTNGTK